MTIDEQVRLRSDDPEDEEFIALKKRKLDTSEGPDRDEEIVGSFIPPSIIDPLQEESSTYISDVPENIKKFGTEPCVLGVDEAGRGPVLGPMVYGVSYCFKKYETELKDKYGFADSKTLNELKRTELLQHICNKSHDLYKNVGWAVRIMTATDISSGMLKPNSVGNYNLNEQAHDATMNLIQNVLDQNVNITEVYVDTVGPPSSYQAKLSKRFPSLKVTVAKKADSLYPCVSTASICAKVTRDKALEAYRLKTPFAKEQWGSGYPSDPKTSSWLKRAVDPVFGWSNIVRYSWQTSKDCLKNNGGVSVTWEDECKKDSYGVESYFQPNSDKTDNLEVSTLWYGKQASL